MRSSHSSYSDAIADLTGTIRRKLDVDARSIVVKLCEGQYQASASVSWPPDPVNLTISKDIFDRPGVLAHEITHCLVPTSYLFFAEGFATWMGCEILGDCSDYLFDGTIDRAIGDHIDRYTPVSAFIDETVSNKKIFHPGNFFRFESRFAHLCAASFVRFSTQVYPELPKLIASSPGINPLRLLCASTNLKLPQLESLWLSTLPARNSSDYRSTDDA